VIHTIIKRQRKLIGHMLRGDSLLRTYIEEKMGGKKTRGRSRKMMINSFILQTYIAPPKETTTQICSKPSHSQRRRTSERCKIWKGGTSARIPAQRGDHVDGPTTENPLVA